MKRFAVIALVLALVLLMPRDLRASSQAEVYVPAELNTDQLILVADQQGRVVVAAPGEVYFSFEGASDFADTYPENTSLQMVLVNSSGRWIRELPSGSFYAEEIKATVIVVPSEPRCMFSFNSSVVNGTLYGGVRISFSLRAYITLTLFESLLSGTVDIGRLIKKYLLGNTDPVYYCEAVVEKRVNNQTQVETYGVYFKLGMDQASLRVQTVRIWLADLYLSSYVASGNLSSSITIEPVYSVTLCGEIPSDLRAGLTALISIAGTDVVLRMSPGTVTCNTTQVPLTPGANQSIVLNIRSGMFTAVAEVNKTIEGYRLTLSRPSAVAYSHNSTWDIRVVVYIAAGGYYGSYPRLVFTASALNQFFGDIPCRSVVVSGNGTYRIECYKQQGLAVNWTDVEQSQIYITIHYTDELGVVHSFEGWVDLSVVNPSALSWQAWSLFQATVNTMLIGMVGIIVLLFISYIKELVTGRPLVSPDLLKGILLTVSVAVVLINIVIPAVYMIFGNTIAYIPSLSKYIGDLAGISDPVTAFSRMIGYYDKLFSRIEADYNTYFIGGMGAIVSIMSGLMLMAFAFFIAALALSTPLTPGAGIPLSSLGSVMLSAAFGLVTVLITQVQLSAAILVALALVRILMYITVAIILIVFLLGTILICVPTTMTQTIGEDFLSAGLVFLLAFPLTGPLSYAVYSFIMDQAMQYASFPIWMVLVLPVTAIVTPLMQMTIFLISAGVALLVVVGTLTFILSRTGIAVGLAEGISGLIFRG